MIKVVSWNMDGNSDTWEVLLGMGADLALLQDPGTPPQTAISPIELPEPPWELERRQRPPIIVRLSDRVEVQWFSPASIEEVTTRTGNVGEWEIGVSDRRTIAAARVAPRGGEPFFVVSMYGRWLGSHPLAASASVTHADASVHRIISDLSAFTAAADPARHRVLAAGDLNLIYGARKGSGRQRFRTNLFGIALGLSALSFSVPSVPTDGLPTIRRTKCRLIRRMCRPPTRATVRRAGWA